MRMFISMNLHLVTGKGLPQARHRSQLADVRHISICRSMAFRLRFGLCSGAEAESSRRTFLGRLCAVGRSGSRQYGNLQELAEAGVIGFKAFMSCPGGEGEDIFAEVDDVTLYEGMKEIARLGLCSRFMPRARRSYPSWLRRLMREGRRGALDFVATRPIAAELEAVNRALCYAEETGCRLHFVHISVRKRVQAITEAKAKGLDVTVETCPHYLALTSADLERLGLLQMRASAAHGGRSSPAVGGAGAGGWISSLRTTPLAQRI